MLTHWDARSLDELLAANGLDGIAEEPFPNDGWSGAHLTLLRRGSERFVLKRTSWATDWIARATRDHSLREAFVATGQLKLPNAVVAPYLGAAADGSAAAILMPDLSGRLYAWERPESGPRLTAAALDVVLQAITRLHAAPSPSMPEAQPGSGWPWTPIRERLELLGRPAAGRYAAAGLPVGPRFLAGWDAFGRVVPADVRDLVESLAADSTPLVGALGRLPATLLHGDLQLANVAPLRDGRIALIDWQMTTFAPVAIELGWLLASNAPILPLDPDAVFARYRACAADAGVDLGDWQAQVDLAYLVGLLLRGWRQGLDAEAGVILGSGAPATDDLARWAQRSVAAAGRWL